MPRKLLEFWVTYNGQDTSEFDEAIGELREKYGEDCILRLHIETYEYPECLRELRDELKKEII